MGPQPPLNGPLTGQQISLWWLLRYLDPFIDMGHGQAQDVSTKSELQFKSYRVSDRQTICKDVGKRTILCSVNKQCLGSHCFTKEDSPIVYGLILNFLKLWITLNDNFNKMPKCVQYEVGGSIWKGTKSFLMFVTFFHFFFFFIGIIIIKYDYPGRFNPK